MNEEKPYEYRAWQHDITYQRIEGHLYHNQANRYYIDIGASFEPIDVSDIDWGQFHWVDTWE